MKNILITTALSLVIISLSNSCNSPEHKTIEHSKIETSEPSTKVVAENKTELSLMVEGMVCEMGCAKYIENELTSITGIIESSVNFEEKIAYITFDKTKTSSAEIKSFINGIHDGQYKATVVETDSNEPKIKENSTEKQGTIKSVKNRFNISFPQLVTYFLSRLK